MTECKTNGCNKAVGKNGRKGKCQKCYRAEVNLQNNPTMDPAANEEDSSLENLFHEPPTSLNQTGVLPELSLVNAAFASHTADYIQLPETAPTAVNELFQMMIQMKDDFNHQLKKRDEAVATLSLCVAELQEELKKHKGKMSSAAESNTVAGDVTTEQSKNDVETLKESVDLQHKAVHQQQVFLEHLANKDRENNLVVTGIIETGNDEASVEELITSLLPNEDIRLNQDFTMKRLGNDETARKPRPLLLQFHSHAAMKKKKVLRNNTKLKNITAYEKVYIKPDQHPVFRKEHARLAKVAWTEKKKAENHGCNITYDRKEGVVRKDNVIIDRLKLNFQ